MAKGTPFVIWSQLSIWGNHSQRPWETGKWGTRRGGAAGLKQLIIVRSDQRSTLHNAMSWTQLGGDGSTASEWDMLSWNSNLQKSPLLFDIWIWPEARKVWDFQVFFLWKTLILDVQRGFLLAGWVVYRCYYSMIQRFGCQKDIFLPPALAQARTIWHFDILEMFFLQKSPLVNRHWVTRGVCKKSH